MNDDHLMDAFRYAMIKVPTRDEILDNMSKVIADGFPSWNPTKVDLTGAVLTVESLEAVMKSIKMEMGDFMLTEPTFQFNSQNNKITAYNPESKEGFVYDGERWAYVDRKKTTYVGPGSSVEKWLNNQLAQHVLKMTMEN